MKAQWKRLLSVLVALALIITMLPVQSAEAASAPKLSTTKKTLLVGNKTTLKVKNVASNAKLTWKSSNAEAVAVSQKGLVKAKKGGESVVSCEVQTGSKVYTLKADITVKDSVVVATQKALKKALANEGITKIKIKTDAKKKFTISKGDYTNKLLIVEAPKADVSNNGGVFKKIAIRSISPNTWIERAEGNKFSISAPESRIVVGKNASVKTISFTEAGAAAKVDVRGEVAKVAVKAPIELNVVGTGSEVKVETTEAAKGTKIVAEVPVNVTAATDIKVELEKGAEGSTVAATDSEVKVEVQNDTTTEVVVSTPEGNQTVNAGSNTTGSENTTGGNTTTGGGSSSGGGSIGGGSSSGGSTVTKKYELQSCGEDFKITPAEGLSEQDITVAGGSQSWEIRLMKDVDSNVTVTVEGNSVFVGTEKIATLSDKTDITGTDGKGESVNGGIVALTWKVDGKDGVYSITGEPVLPSGWSNPYKRGILISVKITSLISGDVYEITKVCSTEDTFVLTPSTTSMEVTSANGTITINSNTALDADSFRVEGGQLKYNDEVIGTLPTTVWVEGTGVKDATKSSRAELEIDWWDSLMYNNANDTYLAVADIMTNANWLNTIEEKAAMTITLSSGGGNSSNNGAITMTGADENGLRSNIELGESVTESNMCIVATAEFPFGSPVELSGSTVSVVSGSSIMLASLPESATIYGEYENGSAVEATTSIEWECFKETDGVYTIVGTFVMPEGWSNTSSMGWTYTLVCTSLADDNLYVAKQLNGYGSGDPDFVLSPETNSEGLNVTATSGVVTITGENELNAELLEINGYQLLYDNVVIGTLPEYVIAEGPLVKDINSTSGWEWTRLDAEWNYIYITNTGEIRVNGYAWAGSDINWVIVTDPMVYMVVELN